MLSFLMWSNEQKASRYARKRRIVYRGGFSRGPMNSQPQDMLVRRGLFIEVGPHVVQ